MGLFDHLKQVKSWADQAAASTPRWARIVGIGGRVGSFTCIDLEMHYADNPPHVVSTMVIVPRRVTPQVGQHVAYQILTGDSHDHYAIDWDTPPQYGTGVGLNVVPEHLRNRILPPE
jgi:hypothetical protein